MIEIVTLQDSPVSDSFLSDVERAIHDLPHSIAVLLLQHRYKVRISRLLTDYYPELRDVLLDDQGGGWDQQKRKVKYFDNIKGAHDPDGRVIIYPEYCIDLETGEPVKNQKYAPSLLLYHEIGHAVDYMPEQAGFRRFSDTLAFIDAYCRDLGHMSKARKKKLDYVLNHSLQTRKEIFADTFSAVLEEKSRFSRTQLSRFPHVAAYIREQILAYLAEIYDDPESLQLLYATLSNMPWRRPRKSFQELVCKARHVSGV